MTVGGLMGKVMCQTIFWLEEATSWSLLWLPGNLKVNPGAKK